MTDLETENMRLKELLSLETARLCSQRTHELMDALRFIFESAVEVSDRAYDDYDGECWVTQKLDPAIRQAKKALGK